MLPFSNWLCCLDPNGSFHSRGGHKGVRPCALLSKVLLWLSRGSSFLFWPGMHEHSHGLHVLQVCELQSGRGPPHS